MRYVPLRFTLLCALGAGMSCLSTGYAAASPPIEEQNLADDWQPVSSDQLNGLRGGFDLDNGLKVSIGIERAVYVNGDLVTTSSLNIPDMSKITAEQANLLRTATGTINVVQNGPGNSFQPRSVSPSSIATVIQNSLDNQSIKNLTVVDATVNSAGFMKNMNFQTALSDSLRSVAVSK